MDFWASNVPFCLPSTHPVDGSRLPAPTGLSESRCFDDLLDRLS